MRLALAWAVSSVEAAGDVELERLREARRLLGVLVLDGVEDVLAGDHLEAVADVDHRLAPRHAGEGVGELLQAADRERQVVERRLGVGAGDAFRLGRALRLLDPLHGLAALRVGVDALGGDLLQVEHGRGDQGRIAGEGAAYVQLAVVGDQHELVVLAQLVADEGPQLAHHAVAVERPEVEVVDVDHQPQPLVRRRARRRSRLGGHRRSRGHRGRGGSRRSGLVLVGDDRPPLVDGVEVGDLDRPAVLEHLEVVLGEPGDGLALLVRDVDVDVDHADVDDVDERLRLPGLLGGRRRERGARLTHLGACPAGGDPDRQEQPAYDEETLR